MGNKEEPIDESPIHRLLIVHCFAYRRVSPIVQMRGGGGEVYGIWQGIWRAGMEK